MSPVLVGDASIGLGFWPRWIWKLGSAGVQHRESLHLARLIRSVGKCSCIEVLTTLSIVCENRALSNWSEYGELQRWTGKSKSSVTTNAPIANTSILVNNQGNSTTSHAGPTTASIEWISLLLAQFWKRRIFRHPLCHHLPTSRSHPQCPQPRSYQGPPTMSAEVSSTRLYLGNLPRDGTQI